MRIRTLGIACSAILVAHVAVAADSLLVDAARRDDLAAVHSLLSKESPVDGAQPDGATALHWAVYRSNDAMVAALLAAGANPNVANELGVTPLMLAGEEGREAIVARLLAAKANPNAARVSGETALMTAIRRGHAGVVSKLLASGASVHAKESWHEQTALMWAASGGYPAIVRQLLAAGADVRARTVVRPQVVNDVPSNYGGAAGTGAKITNDSFGQVMLGGFTSLLFAARQGSAESVALLLDGGANVNEAAADGSSALVIAAHSGHVEAARVLLERGADPNSAAVGFSALHVAVLRARPALVKALLAHGADPNARITRVYGKRDGSDYAFGPDAISSTPALLAANYLEVDSLRALLAGGATPTLTKSDGTTLLLAAIGRSRFDKTGGQFGGVRADPRRGGRALSADETRKFPEGDEEETLILSAVRLLVDAGVDVNGVDAAGNSAMHRAASQSLTHVIQLLADKGANLNAKNRRGQTPLAVALAANAINLDGTEASKPDPRTADLLRRLGATLAE